MPNKNYTRGRRKEYNIIYFLKNLKFPKFDIAQRTAGSHSPFDVIAISNETKEILLIQAKPRDFPKSQEEKLQKEWGWLNGQFSVKFEIR